MTNTATPTTNHTRMTLCANCGETVERQYSEVQRRTQAIYRPATYSQARDLGVAEPRGCWVHLQAGEVSCG